MGLDPFYVDEQLDVTSEYHYDLGYFEGVRGALIIIQQNLSIKNLSEQEKVERMLKDLSEEILNAKILHNRSETKWEEFHLE